MGITTKIGDKGFTSLLFGGCDRKDSLRIESCGALDELSSFLGLAKNLAKDKKVKNLIDSVQRDLFVLGAEIATEKPFIYKLKKKIGAKDIKRLESAIAGLEKKRISKKHHFVVPGENTVSAILDITRSMARKAERRVVALKNKKILKNSGIIIYLNRLSDLLFLMARSYEKRKR
ncbi:MAG: cob(I)yrinic acid a,c-diamide adenosyltransferase [Candidatus Omnitrophica bacterium]|nr:cob(I)yrinic acid a,c-diamide adenosyltransferase [Candidatus Omnitrophota bacterium]